MLGNVIGIEENVVQLKLKVDLEKVQNLINMYVVFEEQARLIVGEIIDIKDGIAYINLLGEFINEKFVFGVVKKPSFGSSVKLVSKEKIPLIVGMSEMKESEYLEIGTSPIYDNTKIGVNINRFFSNHFAIFGSTGSGKSCSVARIFQNLFEKKNAIAYRANIFIFDAYGEYHTAFSKLNEKVPEINFKTFTTNLTFSDTEILKIPLWFLGVDDIALLLNADRSSQLPIIEKALKLINIFAREEELVIKQKNDIIARALLDILSSGRPPAQIRDQIFSVLSHYNTKELNLETQIYQPGYTRPLKHCLIIDATGKIREMELIMNFMNNFLIEDIE